MRVMVIIKADKDSEAGVMPGEGLLTAMTDYNEQLVSAGIMLGGDGLKPSSEGKRIRFSGNDTRVIDGPFAEAKELVAGFWIWQVDSIDHAVQWARKCPNPMGGESEIEIRPLFETEDFGEEFTPELRAREDELRSKLEANQ